MPPVWPEPGHAQPADLAACRELLRAGSKTFFAASLLLPDSVREPATALYGFCRLADDAVDLRGGNVEALARLHERLDRIYAGRPAPIPVDRALADVVDRFAIPRQLLEALFEGFEWDARGRRYPDLAAVRAYGARVAGTVGAMMALLMGVRTPEVLARACDLGVAMQLSNIARDVGEDARAGRLYLPEAWLLEAGIDADAFLADPQFSPALGGVVRRLLEEADRLYARADGGIARLPLSCRPGIMAARLLYAEIGREVERAGGDSVTRRAVVPAWRKADLLARLLYLTNRKPADITEPPLDETRFLVDAIDGGGPMLLLEEPASWWNLDERIGRALELFERLERREQVGRSVSPR